jgi:hypothetical protein
MLSFHQVTTVPVTTYLTVTHPLKGFEVLKAVIVKCSVFWDVTPCSPFKVNRRFGGKYCILLHGRRISHARNQSEACYLLHAGFLLGLFFDPNDGGDIFLRKIG